MIKVQPLSADDERQAVLNAYEILRKHQMDGFVSELPTFVGAVRWPLPVLQQQRQARLRKLISVAKERSPWHAKRLAQVDPRQFVEADLKNLPVMTKADLMANFSDIVTDRSVNLAATEKHLAEVDRDAYFLRTHHAVTSGGSSGVRGTFVYDWDGWINFGLSSARPIALMLSEEPTARARAVAFMGARAIHSSVAFAQSFAPWLASQFQSFVPLSMSAPFEQTIASLNELQPTCLSGYPSFIHLLTTAAADGRLRIRPAAVLVGGEPLLAEHQAGIARHFGARVFNFYGCSEASCLAFSCPQGMGLHVCDDTVILEAVDANGSSTPAGVPSARALLTNLFNMAMPLIRYELDDSVAMGEPSGLCRCGSSFRKILNVAGRSDTIFKYNDDVVVHPLAVETVLARESAIVEYQVRQTRQGMDIAISVRGDVDERAVAEQVLDVLEKHGVRRPSVDITRADWIERTEIGKLQRFIALRSIH